MAPLIPPTDEELTRRAQAGETGALGLLLARHEASMRAVALSLLGYGPDAEDAVQDAALTALRRIGDVRDPAAVGAWLRAIVRNASRMRLRATRETPGLDGLDHLRLRDDEPSHPERIVEQHAMRDWIWDAMEELPQQLRLVLMLRHFSGITSYQEIADACEVPVGTVRSRLHQARGKLAEVLLSTAAQAHDDASAVTEDSRQEALATLESAIRGSIPGDIAELWPAETELLGTLSRPGERIHPTTAMRQNREKGVTQHLRHVVASRDITIWEMDVTNPPGIASPCPPTLAWLMFRRNRRVQTLRVIFPEPT
ncbi:sigma-70 family RNA polymerase sigma factor [Streptomyces spinoverrucosus]|uniref:RNA polymerase sigma factor n=1 Tax=Streptomyces spinoverrucosus TaxID=284043 RepID=UPI0018C42982|nr:sigma-70 family RNA polymerase sigma factor [Streptomyces spinoverrucosus]MBG0851810.1 sigma-70 family RNA polymerase sigma factor [Streptomyces spinoverrucosus]